MRLDELKSEVGQILDRYQVPMDDKSFLLEKIDTQVQTLAQEIVKAVQAEREKDGQQVVQVKEKALGLINGTLEKARLSVKQAYSLGLAEGATKAVENQGPNWWMIGLTGGVLLLASYAGFTLVRDFWFSGKKD
jgi:hypothetical protein